MWLGDMYFYVYLVRMSKILTPILCIKIDLKNGENKALFLPFLKSLQLLTAEKNSRI